ncbi:MAG: carbon storage regulator [Pirellulales bacterium]|nr:carbon storage regulator [Pirellulales bacterium]
MLVLSRRRGEEIAIGGGIVVRVVNLRRNCVELGITAPAEVPIDRMELALRKQQWQATVRKRVDDDESKSVAEWLPNARTLRDVATDELARLGGSIAECDLDERQVRLRGLVPWQEEIESKDKLQAGVALAATGEEIRVFPYTLRRVCVNGAIRAHASQARIIRRADPADSEAAENVTAQVREAIRECTLPDVLARAVKELRQTKGVPIAPRFLLSEFLSRGGISHAQAAPRILRALDHGRDRSAFGLIQAITAVARDEKAPRLKWKLEELGGDVPALLRAIHGNNRDQRRPAVPRRSSQSLSDYCVKHR